MARGDLLSLDIIESHDKQEVVDKAAEALSYFEKAIGLTTGIPNVGLVENVAISAFACERWELAERYAKRLIRDYPDSDDAKHCANTVLGRLAMHWGDVKAAKRFLRASGAVHGSPILCSFGPRMELATELLEAGERAAVVGYLRQCRRFWSHMDDILSKWVSAINAGEMPDFHKTWSDTLIQEERLRYGITPTATSR